MRRDFKRIRERFEKISALSDMYEETKDPAKKRFIRSAILRLSLESRQLLGAAERKEKI